MPDCLMCQFWKQQLYIKPSFSVWSSVLLLGKGNNNPLPCVGTIPLEPCLYLKPSWLKFVLNMYSNWISHLFLKQHISFFKRWQILIYLHKYIYWCPSMFLPVYNWSYATELCFYFTFLSNHMDKYLWIYLNLNFAKACQRICWNITCLFSFIYCTFLNLSKSIKMFSKKLFPYSFKVSMSHSSHFGRGVKR